MENPVFIPSNAKMAKLIRAFDWSKTSLGPLESWPLGLKYAVNNCLLSQFPTVLYCGPEFIFIYNDAYIPIAGMKHPAQILGLPAREARQEIWHVISPLVQQVARTGKSIKKENMLQLLNQTGSLQENYFTCSLSPIYSIEGTTVGVIETIYCNTYQVVHERRLNTLKKLGEYLIEAKTIKDVYRLAAKALEINDAGIPFALLYKLNIKRNKAMLQSTTRLEPGTYASPTQISLQEPASSIWPLALVSKTGQPATIDISSFPPLPSGRWQEPPKLAKIFPLVPPTQEASSGVLIVGISTACACNEDYSNFLNMVAYYIGRALQKVEIYKKERKRRKLLIKIMKIKNAFLNTMGHEFQTPLLLVLKPLEDMLTDNEPISDRQAERLALAQNNALRLQKLVNFLAHSSNSSTFETSQSSQYLREPLDVIKLTSEIIVMTRKAIERTKCFLR